MWWRVSRSVRRFRKDSQWAYCKRAPGYFDQFDQRGYPFNLGRVRNMAHDVLQGTVEGHEVTLLHHVAVCTRDSGPSGAVWREYSVAVLTLPSSLPAVAAAFRLLAQDHVGRKLPVIPPSAGVCQDLPGGAPGALVYRCAVDAEFGRRLMTEQVKELTFAAEVGWRIEGDRLIGWQRGRRTYEDMIDMTRALIAVVAAFPQDVW